MTTYVPEIRGSVKIDVLKDGEIIQSQEASNTLILEAPKMMLANIVGDQLLDYIDDSTTTTINMLPEISGRPAIRLRNNLPRTYNTVNYLRLGYTTGTDPVPTGITASADDLAMHSSQTVDLNLTRVELEDYAVKFICLINVDHSIADRKYYEAALLCPALENNITSSSAVSATSTTYQEAEQVLFARQVHNAIQADIDTTLRYTWTIAMNPPS